MRKNLTTYARGVGTGVTLKSSMRTPIANVASLQMKEILTMLQFKI